MEDFTVQLTELVQFIDWIYLVLFLLLSQGIKKAFGNLLQKVTKFTWEPVYTVLIVATLLAVPWLIWTEATWVEVLVTYTIGTTFYEVILEKITSKIKGL